MFTVKTPQEAQNLIDENFKDFELETEYVQLNEALFRRLAQDIYSHEDVPSFDRSTMDGYAVLSADTFGASQAIPSMLSLAGEVKMGIKPDFEILKGQCAYIPTGGKLPEGADGVVMVEYATKMDDDTVLIEKACSPGMHVIFKGDDVKKGELIIKKNSVLRPQDIGALAALGISSVNVYKKLKIGIISTGDELVDINDNVAGSVVRDVNSYTLAAAAEQFNALAVKYGIVKDDWDSLSAVAKKASDECDIVLISGGSSVGTRDITHKIIDALGTPGVFIHGLAIKPGKPTIVGKINNKCIFGLPGNPVAAYFIFRLFVAPLIKYLTKQNYCEEKIISAVLLHNIPSNHGREEYVPVILENRDGRYLAKPVLYKSGLISILSKADAYIKIERNEEGKLKGDIVNAILF